MMVGKITVDIGEEQVVLTRQELDQLLDDRAGDAVARVPADAVAAPGIAGEQAADIIVDDVGVRDGPLAFLPVARFRQLRQVLDVLAEKRLVLEDHLEAIVIGGIVAAGYLYAAIHF